MSKGMIIVLTVAITLAIPTTVLAATYSLPWTKNIYNVSVPDGSTRSTSVSVFDDGDNKCYVAYSGVRYSEEAGRVAISCVKK